MTRPTSNSPKKRRMRSRLRDRLDGLLAQKPMPIRQERQAAPQVRLLESRFVLDASAALLGLDALNSVWEAQAATVQRDVSGSTGFSAEDHLSDSMEISATRSAQSVSAHRVNEPGLFAGPSTEHDALGLDLDLGVGSDLTSELSVTVPGPRADAMPSDSNTFTFDEKEVALSREAVFSTEEGSVRKVDASDPEFSSVDSGLTIEGQAQSSQRTSEIVFIDTGVQNHETLEVGFREGVEVLILEGTQDGVTQISQALQGRADLDAIHLISHGSAGSLRLGSAELSSESMTQYADALSQIGSSLTQSGDLMLYGCDVAQGEIGQAFISALATATDADVAASNDRTGDAGLGGDWVLESKSGEVGTAVLIDDTVMTGYAHVLAQPSVLSVEVSDTTITDVDDGSAFTVTVTFDQAMNPGGAFQPTLTFNPDVLLAGTLTNPSAGSWSAGDTVFTKTFDVVDLDVEVTDVEIDVTGAENASGEAQTNYAAEAEFSIDTLNPTVAVGIVESQLSDGTPSSLLTFEFSEDVAGFDISDLTATGGVITGFTTVDASSYEATFTANDGIETLGSVSVAAAYTDVVGNAGTTGIDTVAIDRVNPTVTSVIRADGNYTNAGTVDFTVTFSEDVTGVDADGSDFSLVTSVTGASIDSVSGSDSVYTVTVNTGTTSGSIGLILAATPTIQDTVGNALADPAISGANEQYTIASTEISLVNGNVLVADIRDATSDDLILSVVGSDLVISASSEPIAAVGPGITRISDSSVSVALAAITGSDGVTVATGGLDDTVTVLGVERRLNIDGGSGTDLVQLQESAINTGGGDLIVVAENITQDAEASISAGNISLTASLGNLDVNAFVAATGYLKLDVAGEVTQAELGSMVVGGDVTVAAGVIALDNLLNDFQGVVNAAGSAVEITDANSISLGDIDATGDLVVNALAGAIDDGVSGLAGEDVNVVGAATFNALQAISLNDATNDFSAAVHLVGTDLSLNDANDITIGTVSASGDLTVTAAAGSIAGTERVQVSGQSNFQAAGEVALVNALNRFIQSVNASAASVELKGNVDLVLGAVNAATLDLEILGAISQDTSGLNISGDVNLIASGNNDITLDSVVNVLDGPISILAFKVELVNSKGLELGDFDVDSLVVSAGGSGNIVQVAGTAIDVRLDAMFVASDDDVYLDSVSNKFQRNVSVDADTLVLTNSQLTWLGSIDVNELSVEALNDSGILQDIASAVAVSGTSQFTAFNDRVILSSTGNDFVGNVNVVGSEIVLAAKNAIRLGEILATTFDVTVDGIGNITQSSAGLTVAGHSAFTTQGNILLTEAGNLLGGAVNLIGNDATLVNATDLLLGSVDLSSFDVTLSGGDTINQNASGVRVSGVSDFSAAGKKVALDLSANDFGGAVSIDGADVSLGNIDDLLLGQITADNLRVVANGLGGIAQTTDLITVLGVSEFVSQNSSITLEEMTNQFSGVVALDGQDVSLRNSLATQLGAVNVFTLALVAGGDVTQTGAALEVTQEATFTAVDHQLVLMSQENEFGGSLSVVSDSVEISNKKNLELGEVLTDILKVTALGRSDVTQNGSGVLVTGDVTVLAAQGDIMLQATENDFQGAVNAYAEHIALTDKDDIQLGTVNAEKLDVISLGDGAITQDATGINVSGRTALEAIGDSIQLDESLNDFDEVELLAASVVLTDMNGLQLRSIIVDDLLLTTAGVVEQSAGSMVVTDTLEVDATGYDVTLDRGTNDFADVGGSVSIIADNVEINDLDGIAVGNFLVRTLSLDAGGHVSQKAGTSVIVNEGAELSAGGFDITLSESGNDFVGDVVASGRSVVFSDRNDISLFEIDADQLSIVAEGAVVDGQFGDLVVAGNASLRGSEIAIGNDDGNTTRFGSLTFNSSGTVSVNEDNQMEVSGPSTAGGGLELASSGDLLLAGTVDVIGDAGLTADDIVVDAKFDATESMLLLAAGSIEINHAIDPATVTLNADDDITINAAVVADDLISVASGMDGSGGIVLTALGSLETTAAGSDVAMVSGANSGQITLTGATTAVDQIQIICSDDAINGAGFLAARKVDLNAVSGIGDTTALELVASDISAQTTSGDIRLRNMSGTAVNVTTLVTGAGSVHFDQVGGGDLVTGVLVASETMNVTNAAGDIDFSGSISSSDLAVMSAGAVTDGIDGDLSITGLADVTAGSVELGDDTGNMANFGSLTFNSSGLVAISESSSLDLVGVNTAGRADIESTSSVSDSVGGSVDVSGLFDVAGASITLGTGEFNAGSLTFNSSGLVAISEDSSLDLVGFNTAETADIESSSSVSDAIGGSVEISGLLDVVGTSVNLGSGTFNTGNLTFSSGGFVAISEDSSLDLVGVNIADSADIESFSSVSDAIGGSVEVAGLLDVAGSSISLGSGALNAGSLTFSSDGSVDIVEDSSILVSGVSTAGAGLNLVSTDDVTLNASVTVVGDTSIVAGTTAGGIAVNAKLNSSGTILLDAADEITVNAGIDPTTVTLNADDDITVNAAVVASDLITVSAGEDGSGSFILGAAGSLETTDSGSDINVTTGASNGDITLTGTTTALDQVGMTTASGSINGSGLVTSGTVELDASSGIGNTTGIALSSSNITADTTIGDIDIANNLGTAVSVASLTTGTGSVSFDQSGGGDITLSGPVSSGGAVNGGNITLTASDGLVVGGIVSSASGAGGNLVVSGATLSGEVTVGDGDVVIQGGSVDLIVDAAIVTDGDVTLAALRDVIVNAVVDADNGGSIIVSADTNSAIDPGTGVGGHGGVRVTNAGQLDAEGAVAATGSDLFATIGQTDSVLIDADGAVAQVLAIGDITLADGSNAPANASTIINGVVQASGAAAMITVAGERDVFIGTFGGLVSVDGMISVTADTGAGLNGGVVSMADGSHVSSEAGQIVIAADGDITLGALSTDSTIDNAVELTTTSGAIVDGGDAGTDVNANSGGLIIRSDAGVGFGNAVEMSVAMVDVENAAGAIHLSESDDVSIEALNQLGVGEILFEANAGTVEVLASGIGVTGSDDVRLASLGQDLIVDTAVVSATGNITLDAGNDLAVNAAVTTGGPGTLYLTSGNDITVANSVVTSSGDILVDAGVDLTQAAAIISTSGDVGLIAGG
ncbi:MAG: hypothetical protein CBE00_01640, partial [Planctomycetaceae bacterium TMED240]